VTTTRRRTRQQSRASRRGGNLVSVLINGVLLYLLDAHPGWRSIPFLTPATAQVIGLVNLTLVAGIVANVVYFAVEPRWLRAIGDLVTLTISLVTALRVLEVFPFAFHGSMTFFSPLLHVLLVIGIVGMCIGILYSIGVLIRSPARHGR